MNVLYALEQRIYRLATRAMGSAPAFGYRPGILGGLVRQCSLVRSLRASLRFGGVILIARGARLSVSRRAGSLHLEPGSVLTIGTAPIAAQRTLVQVQPRGSLTVSGIVTVMSGCFVHVNYDATLRVGTNTFVNTGSTVWCDDDMTIGRDCAISWNVTLTDSDVHTISRRGRQSCRTAPVVIEDHVWVGAGSTVLKGVHIGCHAVVGAGAVVSSSVPERSLVAGSGTRLVADDVTWQV